LWINDSIVLEECYSQHIKKTVGPWWYLDSDKLKKSFGTVSVAKKSVEESTS